MQLLNLKIYDKIIIGFLVNLKQFKNITNIQKLLLFSSQEKKEEIIKPI